MSLANDSINVTPGTGASVATNLIGGVEYQVIMVAHANGHIRGTMPTYSYWRTFAAGAANQRIIDIFNASGSGLTLKLRKLFLYDNQVAKSGIGHTFDVIRTTAVGTGGTALTAMKHDSADATLPAQVTCRSIATGGATEAGTWFSIATNPEETLPASSIHAGLNWFPTDGDEVMDFTLREGEGLLVKQITSNTAGIWGCNIIFSTE